MKKIILAISISQLVYGYDPVGLFTWPLTIVGSSENRVYKNTKTVLDENGKYYCLINNKTDISKKYSFDTGISLNWWRVRHVTITDTGNNKDVLQHNKPRVAPGLYVGIKTLLYQAKNYPISFEGGYYFQFCQRKNGMRTDYFDTGENYTDVEVRQRVQSVRFGPRLMVQIEAPNFLIGAFTQLSIVTRSTTGLKLYEKSTNAFTGQRLEPYYRRVQGEFGAYFKIPLKQYGSVKIEYSLLLGTVKYKRKIITGVPDDNASEPYNDQLFLTDINKQMFPVSPVLKLRANSVSLGFEFIF